MPTYEYKCDACGHAFEKFQPITSNPVKKCPVCGKNKVRRLISAGGGLIFKGSGFYITDYRDSGYKDSAKADTADGSATKTETAATTETASKGDTAAKAAESKPADTKATQSTASENKPASKAEAAPRAKNKPSKRDSE